MTHILAIGGYSEPQPEMVVEAGIELGYADDGEALNLYDALGDPARLRKAAKGAHVILHSLSVITVEEHPGLMADALTVTVDGGPEPRSIAGLVFSAAKKTGGHVVSSVKGPARRAHAEILAKGGVELLRHPVQNVVLVDRAAETSTLSILRSFSRLATPPITLVTNRNDEFYPTEKTYRPIVIRAAQAIDAVPRFVATDDHHDDLLTESHRVLQSFMPQVLARI